MGVQKQKLSNMQATHNSNFCCRYASMIFLRKPHFELKS